MIRRVMGCLLLPAALLAQAPAPRQLAVTADDGRTRITMLSTRGVDSLLPKLVIRDTAPVFIAPTVRCGTARACPAGWDVMVASVTAPTEVIPVADVPVTVRFTNRGSAPSPSAEAAICLAYASEDGCSLPKRMADVPAIPAQGSVVIQMVAPALRGLSADWEGVFLVQFDPERVTGEKKSDNNTGKSRPVVVEKPPELEWGAFTARVEGGALVTEYELRNPARVTKWTERRWGIKAGVTCPAGYTNNEVTKVVVSDLPARVTVRFGATSPLSPAVVRQLRGGTCTISVEMVNGENDVSPLPGNYIMSGDAVTIVR